MQDEKRRGMTEHHCDHKAFFAIDAVLRATVIETLRQAGCPHLAKQVMDDTNPNYHWCSDVSNTHAPAPDEQQQISDIIKDLEQSLDFYKSRMDMLQCWQSSMRDPERKILCDILANGYTLTTKEKIDTLHTTKEEQ